MKIFTVIVPAKAAVVYEVSADNLDHAKQLILEGEAEYKGQAEWEEDLDSNHWEVCADDSN